MTDLTTLAKAKEWLGVTTSTDDALLSRLVSAASDYIQTWLNRELGTQSYSSYRDGTGGTRMMFRNYPVTSISLVKVDGQPIPASEPGSGNNGYVFTDTSVTLIGYQFTRGFSNVFLQYVAGFAAIPSEIEQACIELVSLRYKERDRIGIVSKGLAGETVTFTQKDFTESIEGPLRQYRRVMLP
jgi:hypothetical protein